MIYRNKNFKFTIIYITIFIGVVFQKKKIFIFIFIKYTFIILEYLYHFSNYLIVYSKIFLSILSVDTVDTFFCSGEINDESILSVDTIHFSVQEINDESILRLIRLIHFSVQEKIKHNQYLRLTC